MIDYNCKNCGKWFMSKESRRKFCSQSCSVKHQNKMRSKKEELKKLIEKRLDYLVKKYDNFSSYEKKAECQLAMYELEWVLKMMKEIEEDKRS